MDARETKLIQGKNFKRGASFEIPFNKKNQFVFKTYFRFNVDVTIYKSDELVRRRFAEKHLADCYFGPTLLFTDHFIVTSFLIKEMILSTL